MFPSYAASSNAEASESGLFGQVMWLVAAALGLLTLGAYLGRDFSGNASIVCWLIGFLCIVGLRYARNAGGAAVGILLAAGMFLGLALGGTLDFYASAGPGAVWQSAGATALSVTALGRSATRLAPICPAGTAFSSSCCSGCSPMGSCRSSCRCPPAT